MVPELANLWAYLMKIANILNSTDYNSHLF